MTKHDDESTGCDYHGHAYESDRFSPCPECGGPVRGPRKVYCSGKCKTIYDTRKRQARDKLAIQLNIQYPDKTVAEVRQMVKEQIP